MGRAPCWRPTTGSPGDGASVEPGQLLIVNDDPSTLRLTWTGGPCATADLLLIDPTRRRVRRRAAWVCRRLDRQRSSPDPAVRGSPRGLRYRGPRGRRPRPRRLNQSRVSRSSLAGRHPVEQRGESGREDRSEDVDDEGGPIIVGRPRRRGAGRGRSRSGPGAPPGTSSGRAVAEISQSSSYRNQARSS